MRLSKDEARKILGVNEEDSEEKVKKAYRKSCLKSHPDKNLQDPKAKEKFQQLNEAYRCLTDVNYQTEDDLTEEELRAEMERMFNDMYQEFKQMCRRAGIPYPDPETAKQLFFANGIPDLSGDEDDLNNIQEQDLQSLLFGDKNSIQVDNDLFQNIVTSIAANKDDDHDNEQIRDIFSSMNKDDLLRHEEIDDADLAQMLNDMSGADADAMLQMLQAGDDFFAEPSPLSAFTTKRKSKVKSTTYPSKGTIPTTTATNQKIHTNNHLCEENNKDVQQQNVIISIGDRAQVRSSGLCGIVKFVGDVHYARGEFVGIALDEPLGKNDGTVKGKSLFHLLP